ncbi:hypothetical protein V6Z11_D07G121000 [Gossypium hirsutum]
MTNQASIPIFIFLLVEPPYLWWYVWQRALTNWSLFQLLYHYQLWQLYIVFSSALSLLLVLAFSSSVT